MPRRFDELPYRAQVRLRRQRRLKYSKSCQRPNIGKKRELAWVNAFFPALAAALEAKALQGKRLFKYEILAIGAYLLPRTGWRLDPMSKTRANNATTALAKVDELLQLPRIQSALEGKFNSAGLTLDECAKIVSNIARGESVGTKQVVVKNKDGYDIVDVQIVPEVKDRLAAVDLRVRMTTGFAVQKSAQLIGNVRADKLFDKSEFEDVPPVALDAEFREDEHGGSKPRPKKPRRSAPGN